MRILQRLLGWLVLTVSLAAVPAGPNTGEIQGRVMSRDGHPLAGVNVVIQGTSLGTATDPRGYYQVSGIPDGLYRVEASSVGYENESKEVRVAGVAVLNFILTQTAVKLSEVTVTATMAPGENAPLTYTTLGEEEITRRHTVQDLPLILTSTPGVYATTDGGTGLGDSQIFIRGFDEKRVQVLVNNIPVNDPESKEVLWYNWGMLSDVAQSIQVQRGATSSPYGSGGLGGMVNIVTKDPSPVKRRNLTFVFGQYGVRRAGLSYHSGPIKGIGSLMASVNVLEGNGWRDNTFYRGLHYYFSASILGGPGSIFKLVLHGAPQYHSLSNFTFNAATFGEPDQFGEESGIEGGEQRRNAYGQYAFGFGRRFNGNVHVPEGELTSFDKERATTLWQALLLTGRIGATPDNQVGGYILANGRASLNNNLSHRPQLEVHHTWKTGPNSRLTSTFFVTRGMDYSDDVYPAWFIPRDSSGSFHHTDLVSGGYYGAEQVFQYRYYSKFFQAGVLSAYELDFGTHTVSLGLEGRHWKSRHAGEVLNTFGRGEVGVPVGSIDHRFREGELFYDFDTVKDQAAVFGHALWRWGRMTGMTGVQVALMRYDITERVPSNKNYPNHIDPRASFTHGGDRWIKNATWDHDGDTATAEIPVEYTLWDYGRFFSYVAPRVGISGRVSRGLRLFVNGGIGVREPHIKHFFGYGSPWETIDLEKTNSLEAGMRFRGRIKNIPVDLDITGYRIGFSGKVMEITDPGKANTPGYDYAGHYYIPIGEATYRGMEAALTVAPVSGMTLRLGASRARNTWGEPDGFEGAQKLYANVAEPGVDFLDVDSDGLWDEGGEEYPLHQNFVDKHGSRYEVGSPQVMAVGEIQWERGKLEFGLGVRHYEELYVMEDNSPLRLGAGSDNMFGTRDDLFSKTLPPVTLLDFSLRYRLRSFGTKLEFALHVHNLLNTTYWQRGDEYGVAPGPKRTVIAAVELGD